MREPCMYEHEYEGYIFMCPYLADEPHEHASEDETPFARVEQ